MSSLWIALAALVAVVGLARRARMRERRATRSEIDDAAIQRIVAEGRLPYDGDDEPLDLEEAARAEEEFWAQDWEDPEEFER
jgi:hypothetical protein